MFSYKKLKSGEVNNIVDKLILFHKANLNFLKEYKFYLNENTSKIYITKVDVEELELKKISGFGLYFGTMHDNDRLRLSIEATQLIEPKKNFVKINEQNLKSYLAGEDLFKDEVEEINWEDKCPFLIVRYKNESLGCVNVKDKTILNYIPKSRRLDFNKVF